MRNRNSFEKFATLVAQGTVIAALLIAWEGLAGGFGLNLKTLDPVFFSRPSRVAADLINGLSKGEFTRDFLFTIQTSMWGLVLGIVSGIAVGFLFAYLPWLNRLFEPLMVAFNSLPRPALAPVLVLILGLGMASKIVLSWSIVFFIVFYNTYAGIMSVDPDLVKVARIMGSNRFQIFRHVIMPSVFSWVFAALRVSVAFALVGAVVGEFVGSTQGLGYQMEAARGVLNSDRVYSILLILMMIGVVLTEISKAIERRLLRWRPPSPGI
ncbi:MAG: ABC transporter permease [Xanthobacteraceae bacterium]|nr:ABC transporter permease [Xanthobacteraceae bacterium]MBX3533443.1 ABC transporter permease [Xanthobacteraceae bacterium]MCW5676383.1 ABC transporter permease [Xanthobacteraceae bacterium]